MKAVEARKQIIQAIEQNTGEYPVSIIDNILESYTKEHAISFACHALIGTGKLEDKDIPTLRQECIDYYEQSEWEMD